MTPERLQAIRDDIYWSKCASRAAKINPSAVTTGAEELLAYIDLLHEDLRITRAERDAEKHKRAQQSKDHTAEILAWDALAEDGRVKAWDEGYMRGQYPFHKVGQDDPIPPNRFPPSFGSNANPYRKDTK